MPSQKRARESRQGIPSAKGKTPKGTYSGYLDARLTFQQLAKERKKQLQRISRLRGGRDVLVYAADLNRTDVPSAITFEDLIAIRDQLSSLRGKSLDLILETPGGSGEVAEDIVRTLRAERENLGVIVPGWAKSAGTIMAMAADEILMEPSSALGPIDAQVVWQGKQFSAGELLDGMERIKAEVQTSGQLNKAYIPILQGISPGELRRAENAQHFSQALVTDWLARFKFRDWTEHSSSNEPVTDAERRDRAAEVAAQLCDHRRWLTHGRSITPADLTAMRLRITDYAATPDLADAIRRYYTLLRMTFSSNCYKLFETTGSQVYRFFGPTPPLPEPSPRIAEIEVRCASCGAIHKVQANLGSARPLRQGNIGFPPNDKLECPNCGQEVDLSDQRRQIEAVAKKPVVT